MNPAIVCFLVGALGGSLFGYNQGIIGGLSGPLVTANYFPDEPATHQTLLQGTLTACILVGGFIGSMISVPLAKKYSVSLALAGCSALCVGTCVALAFVDNFWIIVAIRTVLGVSVGFTCTLCPQYVNDHAPLHMKGRLGTVFQLFITFSIFIAQLLNYLIGCTGDGTPDVPMWKFHLQLGLGAVPGIFLLILAFFLPESKDTEAVKLSNLDYTVNPNLQPMNNPVSPLVPSEYDYLSSVGGASVGIPASSSHLYSSSATFPSSRNGVDSMYSFSAWRWWLVGLILACCNQATGINGIMFYAPEILHSAIDNVDPLLLTFSVVGLWNFFTVFVSFALVDRLSRHALMLGSLAVIIFGCFLLGAAYSHAFGSGIGQTVASLFAIIVYLLAFECGPGPLFWIMAAETFPANIADNALSISNALCWTVNIIISFTFPFLTKSLTNAGTFYLLGGIGVIVFGGVHFCVPRKSTLKDGDVYKRLEVSG